MIPELDAYIVIRMSDDKDVSDDVISFQVS